MWREGGLRGTGLRGAPFPYFGGKRTIAAAVWDRLGDVASYIEPFAGSAAVLLARPNAHCWWDRTETINDMDGMVSNFWRALQADPDAVAKWADHPVLENCLHARHAWLVSQKASLRERLEGDPDYYDAKIAGWWCWGMCCWIGGGFCSGRGPWHAVDGELVKAGDDGQGVNRKLVHLGDDGQGVNRTRVHLGDDGQGVNRKLVHLGDDGRGLCEAVHEGILAWMRRLADRLRRVRVCSGDWARVCTPVACREETGLVGVFLDPPYSAESGRDNEIYAVENLTVAHEVRAWAIAHGEDPRYRIAFCGYAGEHDMPDSWEVLAWKAVGGYGNQGNGAGRENSAREVVWFNKSCLKPERVRQLDLL